MSETVKRKRRRNRTVSEKLELEVRKQMTRRFKSFKITERMRSGVYRSWYCAEPGTWDCSFTITTIPGRLIMTGDLGCLIVERCYDMLPWCRGSCESTHYFAEKVPHEIPTTEFSHAQLRKWIKQEVVEILLRIREKDLHSDDEENFQLLTDALDCGLEDDGEAYYARLFADIWQGNDYPDWHIWKRQFLVQREAIRWFVMNHSEDAIPETDR